MVESLVNDNKTPAKRMDFMISCVPAFERRSVGNRGGIRRQRNSAAVQVQVDCWMDLLFFCLMV